MGLYGSWALLALSHHYLVRYAARRAGVPSKGLYAILGDDIVIADGAIASSYEELCLSLGVGITRHKCVEPGLCRGKKYAGAEFASVLLTPRGETSPLHLGPLLTRDAKAILDQFFRGYLSLEHGNIRRFPYGLLEYGIILNPKVARKIVPRDILPLVAHRNVERPRREIILMLLDRFKLNIEAGRVDPSLPLFIQA